VVLSVVGILLGHSYFIRQLVVAGIISVWGIRLSLYLFIRILNIGSDKRFDEWRDKPALFLRFWIFQTVTVWIVMVPAMMLFSVQNRLPELNPNIGYLDIIGWSIAGIGFIIETISDTQKYSFKLKNKEKWCDVGIWKWSRHPNYFGEFLVWIGVFIAIVPILKNYEWFSVLTVIYLILMILFISGITRLEKSSDDRFWHDEDYLRYKKKTSVLIPIPPTCYFCCSDGLKCCMCCEWGIYNTYRATKTIDDV